MRNEARQWENETPWETLARVAKRVIRRSIAKINKEKRSEWKIDTAVYVDLKDFEAEFEPYLRKLIGETRLAVIEKYGSLPAMFTFGMDAVQEQEELNKVNFKIAQLERPDE